MPVNLEKLLTHEVAPVEHSYGPKDVILYALGLGFGQNPTDQNELQFAYEKNLKALPTWPLMQGYAPYWLRDGNYGLTFSHAVHGEQGLILHAPVMTEGHVVGQERVVDVVDKGEGRGALIYSERTITDKADGRLLATLSQTTFCRADGGFGGPAGPARPWHKVPDTAAHHVCDIVTLPQSALIYRLSGDYHELHADPDYARIAGFEKPILPGRCTFSIAGLAILKTCCDYDPLHFKSMAGRFSAPAYPGETIRTELWRDGNSVAFRASVPARGVVVLDCGQAQVAA